MNDMFLNRDEIQALTNARWKSKQIKVLVQNNIPFTTDLSGRPVVLRKNLINKNHKLKNGFNKKQEKEWEPPILKFN